MNSKKILSLIIVMLTFYSIAVKAVEDIVIHTLPQPDIIPYDFVIDAGVSANTYIKNSSYRSLFISQYASTLKEILFYKMKISDFHDDEIECKKTKDENHKALSCSKIAAAKAVFEKKIPLNIESFGFVRKNLLGKIEKIDDGHGNLLVLETTDGDRWQCILNENLTFSENVLYKFEGLLGPEGGYGSRGNLLKREFLVKNLIKF